LSAIAVGFAVLGVIVVAPQPASAYELIGCRYNASGNSLKWQDVTSRSSYASAATSSIGAWNSSSTQIGFTKVTSRANLRIADGNFGSTGFDGILLDASGVNPSTDNPIRKCRNGFWTETNTAWFNRLYTDNYSSGKKLSVGIHEVGHALGLAHRPRPTGPCSDVSVMHNDTQRRYDVCGVNIVTPDDRNGANALY
jgi:hypothetical protein